MGVATGNGEGEMRYREAESPLEVTEQNEAGLVFRVIESGRLYGLAVNRLGGEEEIAITELETT